MTASQLILAGCMALFSVTTPTHDGWLTNLDNGLAQAKTESKLVLLSFSGSDWCGNCMRLEKTLFESAEFKTYADKHLVLVNADFPMRKKNALTPEQTKHNEGLAEKYNPKGSFPTVLVLNTDGSIKGELVNPLDDVAKYLAALKKVTGR